MEGRVIVKSFYFYDMPVVGRIAICEEGGYLTEFHFKRPAGRLGEVNVKETPLHAMARQQLEEYFKGVRRNFDLPLSPRGTEFQLKVWRALVDIPYGETRCYGQIAEAVGNPKAARAVGLANNRNPLAIFIPCHRVIGANGKLVGFGGGLDVKQALLELERNNALS